MDTCEVRSRVTVEEVLVVGNAISRCAESIELVVQFTTMCSGGESPVQSLTPQVLVVVIGKESDQNPNASFAMMAPGWVWAPRRLS